MVSQGKEDVQLGGSWRIGRSHICLWINREEQLGIKTDHATQGPSAGKESLKTSGYKNPRGLQLWEKLPVSHENPLEKPMRS